MIFSIAAKYLKYILISENRKGHGIHSPFVFDIVNRIFRNKTNPAIVNTVERTRSRMINNKKIISVHDLGSGSTGQMTSLRRVSAIARSSAVPGRYGKLLANMASEFGGELIIEFGTSLGISAMYMAAANREATLITMEGCPETAEIARMNFNDAGLENIRLLVGSFESSLPAITGMGVKPGLVFIDGNHRKEAVLDYFGKIAEVSDQHTVIIIDDINYSKEMEEAWTEIKRNSKVTLTIDIFRMGMVFLRGGILHNDYIIRY